MNYGRFTFLKNRSTTETITTNGIALGISRVVSEGRVPAATYRPNTPYRWSNRLISKSISFNE